MYVDLQSNGFTPLFICGEDISSIEEKNLIKTIEAAVSKQYGEDKLDNYSSIHQDKKVIIFDNFHRASANHKQHVNSDPLNIQGKNSLIDILRASFGKIVLLSDDAFQYQEFVDEGEEPSHLFSFQQCEFREMGHKQRGHIIERWYALGRENSNNEADVSHKVKQVENLINTLLGRDLIPKRPIFVIILLQQHESNQESNTVNGSYGYYYQAIITAALEKTMRELRGTVTRDLEMGMLQNALSYIAFQMFSLNKKSLSFNELDDSIRQYQSDYDVRFETEHLKIILRHAQIMQSSSGNYNFTYPYLAPFFAARHINNGLDSDNDQKEEDMRTLLTYLISKLHIEDYGNILMFFLYFSKDRKTISDLISVARSLFSEFDPFNLEGHANFIGQLSAEPVPLMLGDGSVKQNQDSHRHKLDQEENVSRSNDKDSNSKNKWENESERTVNDETSSPSSDTESQYTIDKREESEMTQSVLNRAQTLNLAMKTMQLMGQILRNFPGALESEPKRIIATECELLGLRILRSQFHHVENNMDIYRFIFAEIVKNIHTPEGSIETSVDSKKLAERTDEMLSRFLLLNTYLSIKRISSSVGSEHLRETYKSIDSSSSPIAFDLIHTSIKLDHFREFPEDEVFRLSKYLSKKRFPRDILRMLVRDRLLLHYETRTLRQQVCKELNIKIKSPKAFATAHKKLPQ